MPLVQRYSSRNRKLFFRCIARQFLRLLSIQCPDRNPPQIRLEINNLNKDIIVYLHDFFFWIIFSSMGGKIKLAKGKQ